MTGKTTVLLVDPDIGIRDSLGDQLEQEGFATIRLGDLATALAAATEGTAALVLLGPGTIADSRLERWRPRLPVLALLDAGQEAMAGVRPFAGQLTRPVRIGELVAAIHRLIAEGIAGIDRAIGPYIFRPSAKMLHDQASARTVRLTEKEVAMLALLYDAGEAGITRERLLAEIWGYGAAVSTHTLETHIYRLRRKIERDPADAQILLTEPGGYRLAP